MIRRIEKGSPPPPPRDEDEGKEMRSMANLVSSLAHLLHTQQHKGAPSLRDRVNPDDPKRPL